MDQELRSAYIQLDSNCQNLSDIARMQYIIKALYNADSMIDKPKLLDEYKKALDVKHLDEKRIFDLIDELAANGTIQNRGKLYYLASSKRKMIESTIQNSELRKNRIIDDYFLPAYSSKEALNNWLNEVSVTFFSTFSSAWMSDLSYKRKDYTSHKDEIVRQIENRTNSITYINKKDRQNLAKAFFKFISTDTPDVNAYLWEYGTTAFSVGLVKDTNGADELTLDVFIGAKCILDTNILIDVALEGNDKNSDLQALVSAFEELDISVSSLYITREEYLQKITRKYREIQPLLRGNIRQAITKASDQFLFTAGIRGCVEDSDFERFFNSISTVPSMIGNIHIADYEEDSELNVVITNAVSDESKKDEYRVFYLENKGREKQDNPLKHDLGLLSAVEHIRQTEKSFILSDDGVLNLYAKQRPFANNLPLVLRIDTLLNVLAVKKNGCLGDSIPFQTLFANIIRNGFQPLHNSFSTKDLSYMLEKDSQVAGLPPERIQEIAVEVNRMKLLGESDKKVSIALMRMIQGDKIDAVEKLEELTLLYDSKNQENENNKEVADMANAVLMITLRRPAKRHYYWKLMGLCFYAFFLYPAIFFIVLSVVLPIVGKLTGNDNLVGVWINVISSVIIGLVVSWFKTIPKFKYYIKNKTVIIDEYVETEKRKEEEKFRKTRNNKM